MIRTSLLEAVIQDSARQIAERLGETQQVLGCASSPDDCSLALRGLKTMAVRLRP